MMIRLSQMKEKEIIVIHTGKRLGYIHDVEINEQSGKIEKLYIQKHHAKGSFFQRMEEESIIWEQVITIGVDIILIGEYNQTQKKLIE